MTANQIAAASEREGERHNVAYEQETYRHNKESERLQSEANDITRAYNDNRIALERELKQNELAYQYAAEEDKVALETQKQRITYELGLAEQEYRNQMAIIEGNKADVDKTYKQQVAEQGWYNLGIAEKRNYYENQKTEAQITSIMGMLNIEKQKLKQEQDRIDNQWALGILSKEQRDKELKLAEQQYQLEASKWEDAYKSQVKSQTQLNRANTARQYLNLGTDVADSTAKIIDSIIPF